MGISVEQYRICIGHFQVLKLSKMKYLNRVLKLKDRNGKINISILLIFSILLFQGSANHNQSQYNRSRNVSNLKIKSEEICRVKVTFYSWAQSGLSTNKLQKIINGNRRAVGYRLAVWNCGRGLVQEGFSTKLHEVKNFLQRKKPHCFGVIESDLFSHQSQTNRAKYSTAELREMLKVDGYKIEFPETWEVHGQARLICYVSEEVKCTRKYLAANFNHLPTITLEIGLGKATKTTVHF